MTDQLLDLTNDTIYECILGAAAPALEEMAGMELPAFEAIPDNDDDDHTKHQVKVSYLESYDGGEFQNVYVEGAFDVPEILLKGIARNRESAMKAFLDQFLPDYRAKLMEYELQFQLHVFERETNNNPFIPLWKRDDAFTCKAQPNWVLMDASVAAVNVDLFKVNFLFQDHRVYRAPPKSSDQVTDYDMRHLPYALSWSEYNRAISDKKKFKAFIRNVQQTFIVMFSDLEESYSPFIIGELERLEAIESEDDEEENPFTTGELCIDSDGRVHFSSDMEN
ncbi:hypothetical protein OU789_01430 [Halocynthiibacter sp. C4]|uniref:hypothetical protein n=1 Tax=Halocynthiibacter sp. C4 TaxID=2992758 RepID=UPI00237AF201|nr:hypothetical protein [Halocynthiibacter sp. C4]MDE0588580.1 hypothetical protein [Halocynthiibacter sp. C4]